MRARILLFGLGLLVGPGGASTAQAADRSAAEAVLKRNAPKEASHYDWALAQFSEREIERAVLLRSHFDVALAPALLAVRAHSQEYLSRARVLSELAGVR